MTEDTKTRLPEVAGVGPAGAGLSGEGGCAGDVVAQRLKKRSWVLRSTAYDRLVHALQGFSEEWPVPNANASIRRCIGRYLEDACKAANAHAYDAGWASVHAATRLAILGMERDALTCRAVALAKEAEEKLRGWRKDAAMLLLPADQALDPATLTTLNGAKVELKQVAESASVEIDLPDVGGPPLRALSYGALRARCWTVKWLLDGDAMNLYAKQRIVINRAIVLVFYIIFMLALIAVLALLGALPVAALRGPPSESPTSVPLMVTLFGALGATFSGLLSLQRVKRTSGKVPDVVLSVWFTLMRPAIGAAAAVVVFLAQVSGAIGFAADSMASVLLVAFVAGFSDALVVRVVGDAGRES